MTGAAWAAASGIGFGVFQSVNRKAVAGMDAFVSTFVQLAIAAVVLVLACAVTGALGDLHGASVAGPLWFALAGVVHFSAGWTFLNLSQQRIGAARTAPLISTVPVFGIAVAAVTLGEIPSAGVLAAAVVVTAGVGIVARERLRGTGEALPAREAMFGLGTALCWSVSPVFTKLAFRDLSAPLLGLTIGILAGLVVYAAVLPALGRGFAVSLDTAFAYKLVAGVLVAFATWSRWFSLDSASVAVVVSLGLLSVPVVLALAPIVSGRDVEVVTARIVGGAALVVAGSLLMVAVAQ